MMTSSSSDTNLASSMSGGFRVLVVDDSASRLEAIIELLNREIQDGEINSAAESGKAWEIASQLDRLDMLIVAIPEEKGEHIFGFRDQIVQRFGVLPGAFYSDLDMNGYYDWVHGEQLFYQPLADSAFVTWLQAARRERSVQIATTETPLPIAIASESEPLLESPPAEVAVAESDPESNADSADAKLAPVAAPLPQEEIVAAVPAGMPEDEGPMPAGANLGDYELSRLIESNEDWALYDAEQKGISRTVNIKALHRFHRRDPAKVEALLKEARARALVNHPAIALVYEANQENGGSWGKVK